MRSEAHLPAHRRTVPFVRYLPRPKRSWWGWAVFIAFIALNETRGLYTVIHILKAWQSV